MRHLIQSLNLTSYHTNMQKIVFTLICLFVSFCYAAAKELPEYELEGNGTGAQGTYLVKVSVLTKDKQLNSDELGRCAVHGVLFKGFSAKELRQQHQKPLAGSAAAEAQHADFFNSFFAENGAYKNYVGEVSGSRTVIKSGKKYRVSATVTVNKEQLRKDLEKSGVIRGLNSGF